MFLCLLNICRAKDSSANHWYKWRRKIFSSLLLFYWRLFSTFAPVDISCKEMLSFPQLLISSEEFQNLRPCIFHRRNVIFQASLIKVGLFLWMNPWGTSGYTIGVWYTHRTGVSRVCNQEFTLNFFDRAETTEANQRKPSLSVVCSRHRPYGGPSG